MRRNYLIWVFGLLFAVASCSFTTKTFNDPNKDKTLIELVSYVLDNGHFDAREIDDAFSKEVYRDYLEAIDPLKRYFYASDIEEFQVYEDQIDDQIHNKDLTFFELTYQRLTERMQESDALYQEILEKPFDFTIDESVETNYEEQPYVSSKAEMKERWRQQLKFSTISSFHESKKAQEREVEEDPDYEAKSDAELELAARESTRSSMAEFFDFRLERERRDWFSLYVNAIVSEYDPHTNYLPPQDKDRFDIAMSGQLEGIGAQLQKRMDVIKIMEVISGGPAWRGDELEVGDEILKVRQEDEEQPVSVVGMRLDDAVDLIKGPKGTVVELTVRKVDGTVGEISITRDVVEIEETYAKASMVEKEGMNFGLINLPKFYFNMEDYTERNAASDVEKEIVRLKEQGMEGLVLDLRNNGGGSLKTVVDIAGLFIEDGPIVQVKSKMEGRDILKDRNKEVLWDGPLVILVNELSASASEILAAAMQDYKRGIVIGSKQTYGKGTVQNVLDLNRWVRNSDFDLGALKLTTQKFYRISGGSTQLEGVKSDVVVPDRYSYIDIGEKDQENPLPWDQIEPADYNVWDGFNDFEEIIASSKQRMGENQQLKLIDENARWIQEQRESNVFPLNYKAYVAEIEASNEQLKKFEEIADYTSQLEYKSLPHELALFEQDTILAEKRNRWHQDLAKDVYIEEAIHVLEDLSSAAMGTRTELAQAREEE